MMGEGITPSRKQFTKISSRFNRSVSSKEMRGPEPLGWAPYNAPEGRAPHLVVMHPTRCDISRKQNDHDIRGDHSQNHCCN